MASVSIGSPHQQLAEAHPVKRHFLPSQCCFRREGICHCVRSVYTISRVRYKTKALSARAGIKNLLRGALLAVAATFLGCFLIFTLPDWTAAQLNKQLPYFFYENEVSSRTPQTSVQCSSWLGVHAHVHKCWPCCLSTF